MSYVICSERGYFNTIRRGMAIEVQNLTYARRWSTRKAAEAFQEKWNGTGVGMEMFANVVNIQNCTLLVGQEVFTQKAGGKGHDRGKIVYTDGIKAVVEYSPTDVRDVNLSGVRPV